MFSIKQAKLEDIFLIAPLFDQYRQFYAQKSNLNDATSFLTERVSKGQSIIFFSSLDASNKALGFVQLYPTFSSVSLKPIWILNDLFVIEDCRGKGVASQLIQTAEEHAKKTNAKGLTLQTAHQNHTAQKLYEHLGWVKDSKFLTYHRFF